MPMIASVIPYRKLPRNKKGIYDYTIPAALVPHIHVGQFVQIPFRSTTIQGVVARTREASDQTTEPLKPLKEIISFPPVPSDIHAMLFFMREHAFVSLATASKTILPLIPKKERMTTPKNTRVMLGSRTASLRIPRSMISVIKNALPSRNEKAVIFEYDPKHTLVYYIKLIEQTFRARKSVLLLTPTAQRKNEIINVLPTTFRPFLVVCESTKSQNENAYASMWRALCKKEVALVIGPRSMIFFPIQNLGIILIDQEHEQEMQQERQNPRYDARTLANFRAHLRSASLISVSHAPRTETVNAAKMKRFLTPPLHPPVIMVNMHASYAQKNFTTVSDRLAEAILVHRQTKENIILFHIRKGVSKQLVCRACGFLFTCATCATPFVVQQNEETKLYELRCSRCRFSVSYPNKCEQCGSSAFRAIGKGTQQVLSDIEKRFGDSRHIFVRTVEDPSPRPENIGLVALVNADVFLHIPSLDAYERTFCMIRRIRYSSQRASVFIQTHVPSHVAIRTAIQNEISAFYANELSMRKTLAYPPFGTTFTLERHDLDEPYGRREAEGLYQALKTQFQTTVNVGKPIRTLPVKKEKNVRYKMQIKIQEKKNEQDVIHFLLHLSPEWTIQR